MQNDPAPHEILEFKKCGCRSDHPCRSRLCTCRREGLVCSDLCGCESEDCVNRGYDDNSDDENVTD